MILAKLLTSAKKSELGLTDVIPGLLAGLLLAEVDRGGFGLLAGAFWFICSTRTLCFQAAILLDFGG